MMILFSIVTNQTHIWCRANVVQPVFCVSFVGRKRTKECVDGRKCDGFPAVRLQWALIKYERAESVKRLKWSG
jgi:hypothetical protein